MKKTFTSALILLVFILFFSNANATSLIAEDIITQNNLPFTLENSEQFATIDVNNDGKSEFSVFFQKYYNPSLEENRYIAILTGKDEEGNSSEESTNRILTELETVPLFDNSLHAINNFPPLNDISDPTLELPYISLFPEGTRIENTTLELESVWKDVAILAGNFSYFIITDTDQTPLESSYIDGVTSGYIGARYNNEDGETFYGWIEISVDDAAPSVTIELMMQHRL